MDPETDDIQSEILQKTLVEVASRREAATASDESNGRCCVICLDNISEACEAKPCGHTDFDYLCLLSWLQEQQRCPLCKREITRVQYEVQGADGSATTKSYHVPLAKTRPDTSSPPSSRHHTANFENPAVRRRRRQQYETRTARPPTENEAILRRQHIYRNHLYSLHVGSNQVSQYRDLTPALFQSRPDLVSRARQWLRRELQVFEFLSTPATAQQSGDAMTRRRANNAEFLLEYIIAILKTVDIQGSCGEAEEMLQQFLGRENTKLLLHELRNFLRSPHSIAVWDRTVQYDESKKRNASEVEGDEPRSGDEGHSSRKRRQVREEEGGRSWRQPDLYRPRYSRDYDPRRS